MFLVAGGVMSLYVGVVLQASTYGRVAGTSEAYENQASIHCGSRGTLSPAAAQETAASSDLLYTDTELIVKT